MKRFSKLLSSLQLTTIVLTVLVFWFTWGILLARQDRFGPGFELLNSALVPAWFLQLGSIHPLLKLWLAGLCLGMVVLAVNLVFCSWTRLLKIIRIKLIMPKVFMLIIHVVFGLVVIGHFGSFVLGYRYDGIKLQQGQSFALKDGYVLTVTDVHFVDNPEVLGKSPKELGPDEYHHDANFAEVALIRNRKQVARGRIYFLRPLICKGIQVTLKRFTPPVGIKGGNRTARKPGVKLVISKNPVRVAVFVLFPVMIAGMCVYTFMTWRPRRLNRSKG